MDKPFPALLQAARALDFDSMDTTDHGHIPYVYILVRALDDWKAAVTLSSFTSCTHVELILAHSTTDYRPRLPQKSENSSPS